MRNIQNITLYITLILLLLNGCAAKPVAKKMVVTSYCGCGDCCGWERGRWKYLKLNFWNKYVSAGRNKGKPYSGRTASGTYPREPYPGLFSRDSVKHPWMIPVRIVFFPWLFMPKEGTIAADTKYYPFGTRIHVPGYGWGVVEDRGGAIKGPERLDIYMDSHDDALAWGKQTIYVTIKRK